MRYWAYGYTVLYAKITQDFEENLKIKEINWNTSHCFLNCADWLPSTSLAIKQKPVIKLPPFGRAGVGLFFN
jgi:hypothetical protein